MPPTGMPIRRAAFRVAADRVDPPAPDHARCQEEGDARDRPDQERRHGQPAEQDVPAECRTASGMPWIGWPSESHEREPARDAQRRQRDDERVGQASVHVDDAVDDADEGTGREHRQDHDRGGHPSRECQRPGDGAERQRRADRQVDAPSHDHQQLADRQHTDDRRLGEQVADVARSSEGRAQLAEDDDEHHESDSGSKAQEEQPGLDRARPPRCRSPWGSGGGHVIRRQRRSRLLDIPYPGRFRPYEFLRCATVAAQTSDV